MSSWNGKDLYMVKLGGAVITDTDKPGVAKKEDIVRLLREIKEAREKKGFDVIIGHGGGSFPHIPAKKYRVNEGIINEESRKGAALVKLSARELNTIMVNAAIEAGFDVFPFDPSSFILSRSGKAERAEVEVIKNAFDYGLTPIIYGDVVMDLEKGVSIASTEEIFRILSKHFPVKKVVLATDVDGVFDKDPFKYGDAKLLPLVNESNLHEILGAAGSAHKVDVTGGMNAKVALLSDIAKSTGSQGFILNGSKPGKLFNALIGEVVECTKFDFGKQE
ncbi:MAG: isopentenyl phosphate kinase [Candidatus Micrarchaeia archaeon]